MPYLFKISRRTTLQWLIAAIAAGATPWTSPAATSRRRAEPVAKGYGMDPDLNLPIVPWPRIMTPHQLQLTAVMSDLILPAADHAPAASAIGVPDFVDEWVSAPYPEQQNDRKIILDGLAAIDAAAHRRWQQGLLEISSERKEQLVDRFVANRDPFFSRMRYLVVGAYYTTPEGFKDIGYVGNVPLPSYPAATDYENAIIDEELKRLAL